MRIVIAPDKFKGSLSSLEVCHALIRGIQPLDNEIILSPFPMADGGDGFATVMKHYHHTTTVKCKTSDPLGRPIESFYEWDAEAKTAIIEMAAASGLVLLKKEERNPLHTSSYGTGIMIGDAIAKGAVKIILGLGGSATNDAGTGILKALGFQFLNDSNEPQPANGEALSRISKIILPAGLPNLKIEIACDVENKMHGQGGAAYVFGPQKGANAEDVELLDDGLKNFAQLLERERGRDLSVIPGTGAAGGIAAGLKAFLDVDLKSGIQIVVEASGIKNEIQKADMLITGEGRIDEQSGQGKVVGHLSALAARYHLPCCAICGQLAIDKNGLSKLGLKQVISLLENATNADEAMDNAAELITKLASGFLIL